MLNLSFSLNLEMLEIGLHVSLENNKKIDFKL